MYIFNSEMHILTFVISVLEFGMFFSQLILYLSRPQEKPRLWYCLLLVLLILYNISCGLFPDSNFAIPIMAQNIISYGSGFLIASYFPCYFYMAFGLRALRWHVFYGVPMFLLIPFGVSFLFAYPVTGKLEYATSYGMIIPGIYALVLLFVLLKAIRSQHVSENDLAFSYGKPEMYKVYSAVVPWVLMGVFVYLHISQWIQVMVTNSGFLVVTVLCFRKTIRSERARDRQLNAIYISGIGASIFEHNCAVYSLTARETEISLLISQGMQYKYIAHKLFISLDTVKSHVKNIFKKVEVNDKTELVYKLSQGVI